MTCSSMSKENAHAFEIVSKGLWSPFLFLIASSTQLTQTSDLAHPALWYDTKGGLPV